MTWYPLQQILISVDILLVLALVGTSAAEVAAPLARQRALCPALPTRAGLVAGAINATVTAALPASPRMSPDVLSRSLTSRGLQSPSESEPRAQLSVLATAAISLALGMIGVLILLAGQHLPQMDPGFYLILALAGSWLVITELRWRSTRSSGELARMKEVLARRGPHLIGSTMFGELLSAGALVLVTLAATHALGETGIGTAELIAVAAVVSMVIRLVPIPWGLGAADATLILSLVWIGSSLPAAIMVTIVWRVGVLIAAIANYILMRMDPGQVDTNDQPTDSRIGRLAHRTGFRLLAMLPGRVRTRAQRRVFDSMMGMSADPWGYDSMPYEQRKRTALVAAVNGPAEVIVEFGCADGHNLAAIAAKFPGATVIGLDISANAIAIAGKRLSGNPDVHLICTDNDAGWQELADRAPEIDRLIISEVLYYLGGDRAMRASLEPLRRLLAEDAVVTLLHGAADAGRLHERAGVILGLGGSGPPEPESIEIPDEQRPFTITVAARNAPVPSNILG